MPLLFFSEVYMEHTEYIDHLQGIVQIPTVSSVNDASTDWSEFDRLHRFLQEAYPLIFEKLEVTTIGKASLLFHWKSRLAIACGKAAGHLHGASGCSACAACRAVESSALCRRDRGWMPLWTRRRGLQVGPDIGNGCDHRSSGRRL